MEYEGHGADNIYNAEKSLEADCGHGENKMVSTDIQLLHCSGPQERHCLTGPHCTGQLLTLSRCCEVRALVTLLSDADMCGRELLRPGHLVHFNNNTFYQHEYISSITSSRYGA